MAKRLPEDRPIKIMSFSLSEKDSKKFTNVAKALGISKSQLFRVIWTQWIGEEPE